MKYHLLFVAIFATLTLALTTHIPSAQAQTAVKSKPHIMCSAEGSLPPIEHYVDGRLKSKKYIGSDGIETHAWYYTWDGLLLRSIHYNRDTGDRTITNFNTQAVRQMQTPPPELCGVQSMKIVLWANGHHKEIIEYRDNGSPHYYYSYNEAGSMKWFYVLDPNGAIRKIGYYKLNGSLERVEIYSAGISEVSPGRLIATTYYFWSAGLTKSYTQYYNSDGQVSHIRLPFPQH